MPVFEKISTAIWLQNYFKRIVLRDFDVCFWYQAIDLYFFATLLEHVPLLFKFRFRIEFLDFLVSAYR
jgi:hypothetical protein